MSDQNDYLEINKRSWNNRLDSHVNSAFYDVKGFIEGKSSLKAIELDLIGDVRGKSILHLQCHFGQDTLSLARMGASVTGVDLSDKAIDYARDLTKQLKLDATFICSDIYSMSKELVKEFDIVFTTYGTIGWLPDMDQWAKMIYSHLKPGGKLVFVEFHPVVWMFDDEFKNIAYNYFNSGPIIENENGTYADKSAEINQDYVGWNHSMSEVVNSLIKNGLEINSLDEFDYSPYSCFDKVIEFEPGKYRIEHLGNNIPMVYSILATKKKA